MKILIALLVVFSQPSFIGGLALLAVLWCLWKLARGVWWVITP